MQTPSLNRTAACLASLFLALALQSQQPPVAETPQALLGKAIGQLTTLFEPPAGAPVRSVSGTLRVLEAEGLGKGLAGRTASFALQAPEHFRFGAEFEGRALEIGRDGQQLWVVAPKQQFGVIGSADVPRYVTRPNEPDGTRLPPIKLPVSREQVLALPFLLQAEFLAPEAVEGVACKVVHARSQPQAMELLKLPKVELTAWIRENDALPARLKLDDGGGKRLTVELTGLNLAGPLPAETWKLSAPAEAKIETVALSQIGRLLPAAWSLLNQQIPTLGPATGARKVLAREGAGWLEDQDGTRVLYLKGTPTEMGRQHGVLLRRQVRDLVDKIVYGVGVGSSFEKGRWFFGEIQEAQRRLMPFMDPRYLEEMDAIAEAAGLEREEVRLANFFPELFHCSGFAVAGPATVDGRLYHGRILDYLKGVGLEPNAVVIVHQPSYGHAWVNVSYAGFVGSVTAMNEKRISIGEMGGRGEGDWDGKPMAQLIREVMEKADSLEEAVEIMRRGPRTCEYYYVIADGNTRQAVGIAATPTRFEVVKPGEAHPQLPHAIPGAVLMSAGNRYEKLAERVKTQHGRLDADRSRALMELPVAMNSNIHSVLFAPETLDLWVANADSKNVASHTRYTHYNLGDLLKRQPEPAVSAVIPAATPHR